MVYKGKESKEGMCVLCRKPTGIKCKTEIDLRNNYIEGCGQLCPDCGRKYIKG